MERGTPQKKHGRDYSRKEETGCSAIQKEKKRPTCVFQVPIHHPPIQDSLSVCDAALSLTAWGPSMRKTWFSPTALLTLKAGSFSALGSDLCPGRYLVASGASALEKHSPVLTIKNQKCLWTRPNVLWRVGGRAAQL